MVYRGGVVYYEVKKSNPNKCKQFTHFDATEE